MSYNIARIVMVLLAIISLYWIYLDSTDGIDNNSSKNVGKTSNNVQSNHERKSTGTAIIASFFIPGLGQIYNGQILKGVLFIIMIPLSVLISLAIGVSEAQKCDLFMKWYTGCTSTQEGATFLVMIMIFAPIFWVYNLYDAYKTAKNTWN